MANYTPMMEQYLKIKEEYKQCLLFFRLGDFYELFFDDAATASKELEIALTGKSCGADEKVPMCGVPFHSAESYISKLIEKGYKVAICEQTEDPKKSKTLVKREVIRVVTPGTVLDSNVLEEGKNNYIACIYEGKGFGFSVCDISTGEFLTTEFSTENENKVIDEIAKYNPSEIICNDKLHISENISNIFDIKLNVFYDWAFKYQDASIKLCNHFKTFNLLGFGIDDRNQDCVCAAGALFEYLTDTQKNNLGNISAIKKYSSDNYMVLDLSSRRNLELTANAKDGGKKGSLLWVLDKTKTSMGARLLRKWLEQPLLDKSKIDMRLDSVEVFKDNVIEREEVKELLNTIYDIERIMGKVIYKTVNAKDLLSLRNSLRHLPALRDNLRNFPSEGIKEIYKDFDELTDIYELLFNSIKEDAPFTLRDGSLIKKGYNEEVDKLREAKEKGSGWVLSLETEEREKTGIKNLKIKYNKVFGYCIEVTNSYASLVPERYIRKQTLANCERYITPKLKEIEEMVLGAEEKVVELEYTLFCEVREKIAKQIERLQKTANYIAEIDVFQSLGEAAYTNGYVKPEIQNYGETEVIGGRHPVVELTGKETFIPNDVMLNTTDKRLSIITGPNMAGKSTYMRQAALLSVMAQIGSFVPAEKAVFGICDRIFTRVGASDDLATGQSTFMVEMSEVANVLNNATERSLLILDEIGRGTSTYDGLSIAWAVLEHIATKIKARTLFATHYHELTELEGKIEGVKNYCVSVQESGENVVFLRKIVRGGANKSYGIHVAKLAGIPDSVIERSNEILKLLIEGGANSVRPKVSAGDGIKYTANPLSGVSFVTEQDIDESTFMVMQSVYKEIESININDLSPMAALNKLYELKNMIIDEKKNKEKPLR